MTSDLRATDRSGYRPLERHAGPVCPGRRVHHPDRARQGRRAARRDHWSRWRAWVTEGGQNAIARVDPADHKVTLFRLPETAADANLNTRTFDRKGILWFTGQSGFYGRLDPKSGNITAFKSPRGPGTYGITATPNGDVWYASLAANHIAKIDISNGKASVVEPPTPGQGARRVWSERPDLGERME